MSGGVAGRMAAVVSRSPALWSALRWLIEGRTRGVAELLGDVARRGAGAWLDVGCGTGRFAPLFPPERYLGIDTDPARLEFARRRHPLHRFSGATLRELLARGAGSFGGALLAQVLHHVPPGETGPLLRDVAALLAPGGIVVVLEWLPPHEAAPWPHRAWHRIERPPNARSAAEWASELRACGFGEVAPAPVHNARFSFAILVGRRAGERSGDAPGAS